MRTASPLWSVLLVPIWVSLMSHPWILRLAGVSPYALAWGGGWPAWAVWLGVGWLLFQALFRGGAFVVFARKRPFKAALSLAAGGMGATFLAPLSPWLSAACFYSAAALGEFSRHDAGDAVNDRFSESERAALEVLERTPF